MRGRWTISHHVRNIAERTLALSSKLRGDQQFPSEEGLCRILKEVDRKQLVAVVGDPRTGKSSVLSLLADSSALMGSPVSGIARRWSYGKDGSGDEDPDGVDIKYLPIEFLSRVELMDTRGVDEVGSSFSLSKALSRVDILVHVVDARSPEGGHTWQFLSHLPDEVYSRTIIAVTHEDFFDLPQQQEIKESIRRQSAAHLGVEVPLFMLRAGGANKGQGAEALRRRIGSMLEMLRNTDAMEQEVLQITKKLLAEQQVVLNNQDRLTRLDSGFLANIEYEIDGMQIQMEGIVQSRLSSLSRYVHDCVPNLARKAARQLGYYLSFKHYFRMPRMAEMIDRWFYEFVRKGVEEQQEYHNREFLIACEAHWESVRPRAMDQMKCEIGPFPIEGLKERLDSYRRNLSAALYPAFVDFGLKSCLAKLYSGHKSWMRGFLALELILVIIAGILGGFGENMFGLAFLFLAAVIWVGMAVIMFFVRKRMETQIREAAEDIGLAVESRLGLPLYEALMSGIADYRKLYTNIRGYVAISASQVAPLMDEYNKIFYIVSAMTSRK